jgi:hypothetical protein
MVGSVLKQKALKERNGNCASQNERLHGHTKSICIADYFNSSLQAKELGYFCRAEDFVHELDKTE